MSNSNGMYNVLNIFKKLAPKQEVTAKEEAQKIYESVESKGSILEGVARVEGKLKEQFAAMKEGEGQAALKKQKNKYNQAAKDSRDDQAGFGKKIDDNKKGLRAKDVDKTVAEANIVHKGTYGNDYDLDADGNEKPKAKAKNPDGQRGRPKAEKPAEYTKSHDLFGRVADTAHKGAKGTKVAGKAMAENEQAGKVEAHGVSGMKSKPWRKVFASQQAFEKWLEKNEGNVEVHGTRELKGADATFRESADYGNLENEYYYVIDTQTGKVIDGPFDNVGEVPLRLMGFDGGHKVVKGAELKGVAEASSRKSAKNPYAIGMAAAMKSTGDKPPLKKSTINKAHKIAKQVNEGINFSDLMKETESGVSEMLAELQRDIQEYKATGNASDKLEAFLKIHHHGKKQLKDAVRPENIPAVQRKQAGQDFPASLDQVFAPGDNISDLRNMRTSTGRDPETGRPQGLDELAKLAGLTLEGKADKDYDKDGKIEDEKDEVIGSRRKAAGLDEAKPDFLDVDKDGDKKEPMKKALADKEKVDEGMGVMGCAADSMEQQQGRINVSTNMSSDGNKNVNISADGDAADQLMAMLKMAGLGGGQTATKLAIAVPADSGAGEPEIEMEETEQYANTPAEEYEGIDAIVNQGDDMNRQKKQYADKPKAGDNPMATQEAMDPIKNLGRDLMAEYQSLKLQK